MRTVVVNVLAGKGLLTGSLSLILLLFSVSKHVLVTKLFFIAGHRHPLFVLSQVDEDGNPIDAGADPMYGDESEDDFD